MKCRAATKTTAIARIKRSSIEVSDPQRIARRPYVQPAGTLAPAATAQPTGVTDE
jgi:hypothetical protein